ncbi:MAG TPA: hypothetical protein VH063_05485 [Gaiellaceae bacterium]|jgi:hypothetical protein|nr:hypothetical protein [Gaiellaceae bacterium]
MPERWFHHPEIVRRRFDRAYPYVVAVGLVFLAWSGWLLNRHRDLGGGMISLDVLVLLVWLTIGALALLDVRPFSRGFGIAFVALFMLVGQFASIYLAYGSTRDWSTRLTRGDALFVSMGTFTTAGTGGITAVSETARLLMTIQMSLDVLATAVVLGLVVSRLSALARRESNAGPPK